MEISFPPTTYIAPPCELPEGFNINLPGPRLEAIRTFTRGLIDRLEWVKLDLRPLGDVNDINATRWKTVEEGRAEMVAHKNLVRVQFDMRFMNWRNSTTETVFLTDEHRKELSKALDVVQIQKIKVKHGIWKIELRLPQHMVFGFNFKVEMRVVAQYFEPCEE